MKYFLLALMLVFPCIPPLVKALRTGHTYSLKFQVNKFQLKGKAQGTTWMITYYATDSLITHSQVDSILNQIDSSLSLYKPYSLINAFNRSATGLEVDKHFLTVIKKSIRTFNDTKGLFDITVQPLVRAWGFGNSNITHLPDSQTVNALMKSVGSNNILVRGNSVIKKIPCVTIDVNGIAQGYSVDVLADFLKSNKIKDFIVELGGEIRISGRRRPSGELMKIGIEAPADASSPNPYIQKIISVNCGAITTSGNYRKVYESDGKKINHIINPATGYPVNNDLISVTVYARDAITADAYDNALLLMGLKDALKFVEKHRKMSAHFIFRRNNGQVADTASSRFPKLIEP